MIVAVAALLIHSVVGAPPAPVAPDANSAARPESTHLSATFPYPGTETAENSNTVRSATETDSARMNLSDVRFDEKAKPTVLTASVTDSISIAVQNSQSFSTMRMPDPEPAKEHSIYAAVSTPSRRMWIALSAVQHGAAAFDAYSTRQSIGHGGVEDDPLMRPFANSPAIYVATQVTPVLLDLLARHMQRSEYGMVRRVWWVPQSLGAGVSIFSGVHNLHVAAE
jgi:hypothetical protein